MNPTNQFGYKVWCLALEHMSSIRKKTATLWLAKQSVTLLQVLKQVEIEQEIKLFAIITRKSTF
jgi:hypothetical protein